MLRAPVLALYAAIIAGSAQAADKIEAVGGQKCNPAASYTVEFIAPDDAQLEANAKANGEGASDSSRDMATLFIDGRPCPGARCGFRATKGNTYTLVAQKIELRARELCISVGRP